MSWCSGVGTQSGQSLLTAEQEKHAAVVCVRTETLICCDVSMQDLCD